MAKKSTIRVSKINKPQLVFTHAVTKGDLAKLHSQPTRFEESTIADLQYIEEDSQRSTTRRAKATLAPKPGHRWSFRQTLELHSRNECIDRGVCIRAVWDQEKSLEVRWNDFSWDLAQTYVRHLRVLNMTGPEQAYWTIRLVHSGEHHPNVLGYVPDRTLRVFRYAVPLAGISNSDAGRLLGHSDFGLTSSDSNDAVNKLIGRLTEKVDNESWAVGVPKVFGAVVASSPVEAEKHALRRAQFAADLITFALAGRIKPFRHAT